MVFYQLGQSLLAPYAGEEGRACQWYYSNLKRQSLLAPYARGRASGIIPTGTVAPGAVRGGGGESVPMVLFQPDAVREETPCTVCALLSVLDTPDATGKMLT